MTKQEISFYDKPQTDTLLSTKANAADLATVATTGSYDDLTNKPTIPAAQVQSDWSQSDNKAVDYIKNKPDLSEKLDKSTQSGGTFVYTQSGTTQSVMRTTDALVNGTIPYRSFSNGTIEVGTPVNNAHAATKGYVDSGLLAKLNKTSYEWNQELSVYANTNLLLLEIGVYDSNITIDIDSTTVNTYHGTLLISSQNYVTRKAELYGDPTNTIAPMLSLKPATSSSDNKVRVYFNPPTYSKNLIHIQGLGLSGEVKLPQVLSEAPSDNTMSVTNIGTFKVTDNTTYYTLEI